MPGTTWESRLLALFDDLEQQAAGLELAERETEVADLSVTEYARVRLSDRLRASTGRELVLLLAGEHRVSGVLTRCGEEWLVLRDAQGGSCWLVPTASVVGLDGLSPRAALEVTASVADRLPLRALLRRVSEAGDPCRLQLRDGSRRDGRLGRVGHDFLELRTGGDRDVAPHVVPTAALAAVRWSAW